MIVAGHNRLVLFELESISVARGGSLVIEGLNADIAEGATAVVGPSGVGKSSLLRLLNRLADPVAGRILYRGELLAGREVHELRREVALVPQLPALLDGTVADNLRFAAGLFGRELGDAAITGLLERAGLDGSFADRPGGELSVGERQRAMLARALVNEPGVLLLDEPTSALDAAATEAIERTLAELREEGGLSLVVVTHDPAQAQRLGDSTLQIEPREGEAPAADGDRAEGDREE